MVFNRRMVGLAGNDRNRRLRIVKHSPRSGTEVEATNMMGAGVSPEDNDLRLDFGSGVEDGLRCL
jgi:hypothetical protein